MAMTWREAEPGKWVAEWQKYTLIAEKLDEAGSEEERWYWGLTYLDKTTLHKNDPGGEEHSLEKAREAAMEALRVLLRRDTP